MVRTKQAESLRAAAMAQADALFLDEANEYGCAETSFMTLKRIFGLDDPMDPAAAIALNGGIAYSGGICGALSGAALAVGMLCEERIVDHARAKRVARELVHGAMESFQAAHGKVECRELIGYDLRAPGQHQAFIDSGLWREACAAQIRSVVAELAVLADPETWARAVRDIERTADR